MTLLSLLCSQPTQTSSMDQHFLPVSESTFIQWNQLTARSLPLTTSSKLKLGRPRLPRRSLHLLLPRRRLELLLPRRSLEHLQPRNLDHLLESTCHEDVFFSAEISFVHGIGFSFVNVLYMIIVM